MPQKTEVQGHIIVENYVSYYRAQTNISERCCMKPVNPSSSPRRQLRLSPSTDVESEDQRGHIAGH